MSYKINPEKLQNINFTENLGLKALTELSPYAVFHFTYLGYSFLNTRDNTIVPKFIVFNKYPKIATKFELPDHYLLVEYGVTAMRKAS
ncbi:MAG: hypothetical protein ACM31G_07105 [Flavobacteriales bacterium]